MSFHLLSSDGKNNIKKSFFKDFYSYDGIGWLHTVNGQFWFLLFFVVSCHKLEIMFCFKQSSQFEIKLYIQYLLIVLYWDPIEIAPVKFALDWKPFFYGFHWFLKARKGTKWFSKLFSFLRWKFNSKIDIIPSAWTWNVWKLGANSLQAMTF